MWIMIEPLKCSFSLGYKVDYKLELFIKKRPKLLKMEFTVNQVNKKRIFTMNKKSYAPKHTSTWV